MPKALSTIFSDTLHHATDLPTYGNLGPGVSPLIMEPAHSEFNGNNQTHSQHSLTYGRWAIAISVLLVIFVLQYAYFMRNELARHDVLRPWLEKLCHLAACEIPMRKDVSKIIIVNRDIRSTTDTMKTLQVNLALKNIAPFAQPFPIMQLNFSDVDGNRIASRRFIPGEYLSKQIDIDNGMTPHVPVIANLHILDPGEDAITFEFEFF